MAVSQGHSVRWLFAMIVGVLLFGTLLATAQSARAVQMCVRYVGAPTGPWTGRCQPPNVSTLPTIFSDTVYRTLGVAPRTYNWMETTTNVCGVNGLRLRVFYQTTSDASGAISGSFTSGSACTTQAFYLAGNATPPASWYSKCRLVSTIGLQTRKAHCFTGYNA